MWLNVFYRNFLLLDNRNVNLHTGNKVSEDYVSSSWICLEFCPLGLLLMLVLVDLLFVPELLFFSVIEIFCISMILSYGRIFPSLISPFSFEGW